MDTITLVDELIDDGRKLIDRLIQENIPVIMACWVKPVEDDRWSLYIATPLLDEKGAARAYREVYRVLRSLGNLWVTDSDIKLVGQDDPITRDVIDIKKRFSVNLPTRSRRPQLGNVAVEETYIYPATEYEEKPLRQSFTVNYLRKANTNEWKAKTTREEVIRGTHAKASGRNYFTCRLVIRGLMVMSYLGSVVDRSNRASTSFISLAGTRTPSGYSPSRRFTVGC